MRAQSSPKSKCKDGENKLGKSSELMMWSEDRGGSKARPASRRTKGASWCRSAWEKRRPARERERESNDLEDRWLAKTEESGGRSRQASRAMGSSSRHGNQEKHDDSVSVT